MDKRNTLFSLLGMIFSLFALILLSIHVFGGEPKLISPLPDVTVTPVETSTVSGTLTPVETVVVETPTVTVRRATPTEVEPTLVPVQ